MELSGLSEGKGKPGQRTAQTGIPRVGAVAPFQWPPSGLNNSAAFGPDRFDLDGCWSFQPMRLFILLVTVWICGVAQGQSPFTHDPLNVATKPATTARRP